MPTHPNRKNAGFRIRYQKLTILNSYNTSQFIVGNYTEDPKPHDRSYVVKELLPYSRYVFQVQELALAWGPYSDPVFQSTMEGRKYLGYYIFVTF